MSITNQVEKLLNLKKTDYNCPSYSSRKNLSTVSIFFKYNLKEKVKRMLCLSIMGKIMLKKNSDYPKTSTLLIKKN